jgi:hypothetical protein
MDYTCSRCNRPRPLSEFPKFRGKRNGTRCLECLAEIAKDRRRAQGIGPPQRQAHDGVCRDCHQKKPLSEFHLRTATKNGKRYEYRERICKKCRSDRATTWYQENQDRYRKWRREQTQQDRNLCFDHYGRTCACCGETERAFLQFDHVNGGGRQHSKVRGEHRIATWLRQHGFPDGYQVLCANCNHAKGILGQCPHALSSPRP